MKNEKKIKLNRDAVVDFVRAAEKCDFDVDIFYNRFIIDAKSIMGVFSLDLSKKLTVRYNGVNPEFEEVLDKYRAA